jgi:hypothetical protein
MPFVMPFVDALVEQGAPCLRTLYIWDQPRLVLGLAQFSRLEELDLLRSSMGTVEALEEALDAAGGAEQFLPALRELQVSFEPDEEDMEDSRAAFLEWAGRTGAFPQLHELRFVSDQCGGLGSALAAGAFASIQQLCLSNVQFGIGGMEALAQGLVEAPCAQTLRLLFFIVGHEEDGGWYGILGAGIGRFPALAELMFENQAIDDEAAAVSFASALTVEGSQALEVLRFRCARFSDEGLTAMALALWEGRLGAHLMKLCFHEGRLRGEERDYHLTDSSVVALAEALAAGKQFVSQLESLQMFAPRMTMKGARLLAAAAASHCPKLRVFGLRDEELDLDELVLSCKWSRRRERSQSTHRGRVLMFGWREGEDKRSGGDGSKPSV